MKRIHDTSRLTEFFIKAGLIAAIAAALLAPMTINAHGSDAAHGHPALKRTAWDALPLPPIPHLETMPWLNRERPQKTLKIDTLLAPTFELTGPAVAGTGQAPLGRHGAPMARMDTSWNG